jgi:hypothetical protein
MTRHSSILLLLAPLAALATSQLAHTVPQRAMASDRVVVAQVVERRTVVDPADPRRIKTHTQLNVKENLRGTGPSQVNLIQLGGTSGDTTIVIPGDATFTIGEEAVLFLHCPATDRCYLVAMGEGKLPIVDRDQVIVHDMVTNEHSRRSLKALSAELRALPPGKVRGPLAPENARGAR